MIIDLARIKETDCDVENIANLVTRMVNMRIGWKQCG